MVKWRNRHLLAMLLCLAAPAAWAQQTLRFAALSSWTMPYGDIRNNQLVGGILFDLAQALQKPLGMPVSTVVLPRKRIDRAATTGDIDLRCYLTPKWTDVADQFVWSGRLFEMSEVLFGNESAAPAKDLSEIRAGATVSTVLGYVYPLLEPRFSNGTLVREDTVDQEKVMRKLGAGHTHYGVSDVLALRWYQRNTPQHHLSVWNVVVSRNDFQCGIPKAGHVAPARILAALEGLRKSGQMEEILRNYR